MLFSSPVFLLFFAVYLTIHLLTPQRHRLMLMIVGGAVFYGYWYPLYAWLPFALALVAYVAGQHVDPASGPWRIRAAVAALLVPLLFFKYADFLTAELSRLIPAFAALHLGWPLPLGVSFITFTLIAYIVDVHRGRFATEPRFSKLAAYTLFFPHVIAGPILRPHELLPQLEQARATLSRVALPALTLFTLGLFKKLVVADTVGATVDRVYGDPLAAGGIAHIVAIYGFGVQIYCDFSGYTDMAIALALILGVRFPANFRQPYAATSPIEFWRRWHMTLSRWLRDYLYIPIGGNRGGPWRQTMAILATMTLGGLWHGAAWTFVLWGIYHGMLVAFTHLLRLRWPRFSLPRPVAVLIVFHLVMVGWVLFRAPDLLTAAQIASGPFVVPWESFEVAVRAYGFTTVLIALTLALHRWDDHRRALWAGRYLTPAILGPALALLWLLTFILSAGESARFIYFDF